MSRFSFSSLLTASGLLTLFSAITAVNADCVSNPNYVDVNGNVYNLMCGMDTSGLAFSTVTATDYTQCFALCDAATGCDSFTYNPGSVGGQCLLKKGAITFASGAAKKIAALLVSSGTAATTTTTAAAAATTTTVAAAATTTSTTTANPVAATTSTTSSTTTSAAAASTATTATSSSGNSCSADAGTTVTDSSGVQYSISCATNTQGTAYNTYTVSNGFSDCFALCDNSVTLDSTVCTGFTFVSSTGNTDGAGAGSCLLKNTSPLGTSASNTLTRVAGVVVGNSSGSSSSSTGTSATTTTVVTQAATTSTSAGTFPCFLLRFTVSALHGCIAITLVRCIRIAAHPLVPRSRLLQLPRSIVTS